jgi:hypothetical protein
MNERTIFKEAARSERACFEFVERCCGGSGVVSIMGMQILRWPDTAANDAFCSPFSFREKPELIKSKLHNHLSTISTCSFLSAGQIEK